MKRSSVEPKTVRSRMVKGPRTASCFFPDFLSTVKRGASPNPAGPGCAAPPWLWAGARTCPLSCSFIPYLLSMAAPWTAPSNGRQERDRQRVPSPPSDVTTSSQPSQVNGRSLADKPWADAADYPGFLRSRPRAQDRPPQRPANPSVPTTRRLTNTAHGRLCDEAHVWSDPRISVCCRTALAVAP